MFALFEHINPNAFGFLFKTAPKTLYFLICWTWSAYIAVPFGIHIDMFTTEKNWHLLDVHMFGTSIPSNCFRAPVFPFYSTQKLVLDCCLSLTLPSILLVSKSRQYSHEYIHRKVLAYQCAKQSSTRDWDTFFDEDGDPTYSLYSDWI